MMYEDDEANEHAAQVSVSCFPYLKQAVLEQSLHAAGTLKRYVVERLCCQVDMGSLAALPTGRNVLHGITCVLTKKMQPIDQKHQNL